MPLGAEENLGPGDVVLDGVTASPLKGIEPPVFGPCLLWPNGWMDEDATRYGYLGPGHFVLDGFPAIRERGTAAFEFLGDCF